MFTLRPATLITLVLAVIFLMSYIAYEYAHPILTEKEGLVDFDAFYLVATMISEGNLAGAYDANTFYDRQKEHAAFDGNQLIWSYPPPFNLVVNPFILAPEWLSYLLFIGLTFMAYLWILQKVAGTQFHTSIILCLGFFPLLLRSGQNGFLTGGLIGLTCLFALRKSNWAGVSLGLMVIKPHLALAIGLWSLLDRRWVMATAAIGIALLACAVATAVYGVEVWSWFHMGITTTGEVLRDGRYPLFRMTSIFASALSAGLSPSQAMAVHLSVAIGAIAILIAIQFSDASQSSKIGMAVFVSALISPYNYDYDLTMLAFAFALLLPTIAIQSTTTEKILIWGGMWIIGFYGLSMTLLIGWGILSEAWIKCSISGPILALIGLLLFRIEQRRPAAAINTR